MHDDRLTKTDVSERSVGALSFSALRRVGARALLAVSLVVAGLVAGPSACSDGNAGTTGTTGSGGGEVGDPCKGGVLVDGVCEGKCVSAECVAGNTCVGNRCVLTCDSHLDCNPGEQSCVVEKDDETGLDVPVCRASGKPPAGATCPFGDECGGLTGACPDGRACNYTQCGGAACVKDDVACGKDAACTAGKCPDGSGCAVPACAADQCKALGCITTGTADADAYCTLNDCKADADCSSGFYCGIVRDKHGICDAMPAKGDNNFCGKTTEPCMDAADFGANGASYFEGSMCILRKACLKRAACAPCEADLDCSLVPGQRCVQAGPDKRCAADCGKDADCTADQHCVEASCVPRYAGGCIGKGEFCDPCLNDEDCGSAGSTMGCMEIDGLSHERACVDLAFPTTCATSADCPKSPGGKSVVCLDEDFNAFPGDSLYHHCYIPIDTKSGKSSCW